MYCERCGQPLDPEHRFCRSCGHEVPGTATATAAVPPPEFTAHRQIGRHIQVMPSGRMGRHIRIAGVLWIVISVFRAFGGGAVLVAGRLILPQINIEAPLPIRDILPALVSFVGLLLLAGGIAGLAAGWGMLQRQGWARTLAIICSIISIPDIPVGTALGVYTLWVLLSAEGEAEYRKTEFA